MRNHKVPSGEMTCLRAPCERAGVRSHTQVSAVSKIYVSSAATHWFPVLHLNLLRLICVSAPPFSVGLCFRVSLSPPFLLPSLPPLCLPRTAPGSGSGNAAGSSSLAIASSITRVSAPAGMGWAPPPPNLPFLESLGLQVSCVIRYPCLSFCRQPRGERPGKRPAAQLQYQARWARSSPRAALHLYRESLHPQWAPRHWAVGTGMQHPLLEIKDLYQGPWHPSF